MKIVRIVFGLIGAAWLIGVMALGLGTTWIQHDPETAAGVALGAMAVDGNASVSENASAFAGGYRAGKDLAATARSAEAKYALRQSCAAQEDSDWGAPAECEALADSDRETYERLSDNGGW